MSTPTLRALSRAFAAGTLDRAAYRRQRRELLQNVVSGTLPVHLFVMPEPEARTVFPSDDDEGDTTQEIIAPVTVPRGARGRPLWPWLTLAAVVLTGSGWYAWQQLRAPEVSADAAPAAALGAPTADLIDTFLAGNSWQGSALTDLRQRWDALDATRQAQAREGQSMRRMEEQLLGQVQAENALMALGDGEEPLAAQAQLLDLMDHFGVSTERLGRARAAWRTASDAHAAKAATASAAAETAASPPATAAEPAAPAQVTVAATPPAQPATSPAAATTTSTPAAATTPAAAVAQSPPASKTIAPAAAAAVPATAAASPAATSATATASTTPGAEQAAARPKAGKRGNCKADLAKTRRPFCIDLIAEGIKGPPLVVLPAGSFDMGGEQGEEQPRHPVSLAQPFAIGMFEVSAAELSAFCTATATTCPTQPWEHNTALPAVNVSWSLANAYAAWLSKSTGAQYRLPTEAEWEYAARAGTTGANPFGGELLPTHARYSFKNVETSPLTANDRSVNANEFRLYHMLGNVREWVQDVWSAGYAGAAADGRAQGGAADAQHVARGGSYADRAAAVRSGARVPAPASGDRYTGFRVVRVIE